MLVLVDTNVLLRVVEPRHAHHSTAVTALRVLAQTGYQPCLVPQVHYEFWVAATRPIAANGLGLTPAATEAALRNFGPPLFRLLRDERAIYPPWRELVNVLGIQGKQAHDARLVAAMHRHSLRHLLTFNTGDFRPYVGITVLEPTLVVARK